MKVKTEPNYNVLEGISIQSQFGIHWNLKHPKHMLQIAPLFIMSKGKYLLIFRTTSMVNVKQSLTNIFRIK